MLYLKKIEMLPKEKPHYMRSFFMRIYTKVTTKKFAVMDVNLNASSNNPKSLSINIGG